MTVNCSICLNIFKEPACLPCGHIYCSKCLSDHINALPNKGMTASCPECRTDFNIFTPELACLPKQYHQFILPSVRRVYLDLSACSTLQRKLEQAEARLKVHKDHEEALSKRCESLSAAVNAHRVGESKALQDVKVLRVEMAAYIKDRQHEIDVHSARYQKLDQEHQALQGEHLAQKRRLELTKKLNKQLSEPYTHVLEAKQEEGSRIECSGPSIPPRSLATEVRRVMKPLPKRRVTQRTRSNSPPPIYDNLAKRPRLSESYRPTRCHSINRAIKSDVADTPRCLSSYVRGA